MMLTLIPLLHVIYDFIARADVVLMLDHCLTLVELS